MDIVNGYANVTKLTVVSQRPPRGDIYDRNGKAMVDQGGTVKPRERFAGGAPKTTTRATGSLKAVDPVTGDIKATQKLDYQNWGGVLATAGNLVFLGQPDGTFSAHENNELSLFGLRCTAGNRRVKQRDLFVQGHFVESVSHGRR